MMNSTTTPTDAEVQFLCRGEQVLNVTLILNDEGGSTISEQTWATLDETCLAEIAAKTGLPARTVDYAMSAGRWIGDTDDGAAIMVANLRLI